MTAYDDIKLDDAASEGEAPPPRPARPAEPGPRAPREVGPESEVRGGPEAPRSERDA
jgi:hypothetical protein